MTFEPDYAEHDERDDYAEELADLVSHRITDAVDRMADAMCRIALSPKTIPLAQKKLDKLERKQAAIAKDNAEREAALDGREAELAQCAVELEARESEIARREAELAASLAEARDNLRSYYDSIADADRRLRYRILSHADLLHGYNERLQDLPDWPAIKQMVPGLPPDDPPAAPPTEAVFADVREDWAGNVFVPDSTLTRTINKAAG